MIKIPYDSAPNGSGLLWKRYIEHGIQPGNFMQCILKNDLIGAVRWADSVNKHLIWDHCMFLWSYCPMQAWGSEEAFYFWSGRGGFAGLFPEEFEENESNIVEFKRHA